MQLNNHNVFRVFTSPAVTDTEQHSTQFTVKELQNFQ